MNPLPLFSASFIVAAVMTSMCVDAAESKTGVTDQSPLAQKADALYQNLIEKHSLDGLYISITPTAPPGVRLEHTTETSGNVIHAGVWTGRYLGGVGYWYAVTRDPAIRKHGGEILNALRILRAVTGKPGLLARGYVKGHGPVFGWERDGNDSAEWHQGQGEYSNYRFYGDVSVDNLNAVLYGYAIYFDLAADDEQKKLIASEVDQLMTHLLDNHCRIIDLDGEPTMWGHVGVDPDPQYDDYYKKLYETRFRRFESLDVAKFPLRVQLMLLPDLLIAHHITGKQHYLDFYYKVIARFKDNPEPDFYNRLMTSERLARFDHSPEGQSYEALYNLIRYEKNEELLKTYRSWVSRLWENNWTEGNSLFAFTTLVLLPKYRTPDEIRLAAGKFEDVIHGNEGLNLGIETLRNYKLDRVFRPVMGSFRTGIELNPFVEKGRPAQSLTPIPIQLRPHDNEYVWKGNPYQLDGNLKPHVTSMQFSPDDSHVAWFTDSSGRAWATFDRGTSWRNISSPAMGASFSNLVASKNRTFVLWAQTSQGVLLSRDGGLSWRTAPTDGLPEFRLPNFQTWLDIGNCISIKIDEQNRLVRSSDGGTTSAAAMDGWLIPIARSFFVTPWGLVAGGPGGTYVSSDAQSWKELKLWQEQETGAADFLHAYWMGRYYGFLNE
ncbi:MAG: hypothetical protein FJ267_00900 [Planctomycetes bacterium]|nr:hypothetical protein [Planctomycetota bacterium]